MNLLDSLPVSQALLDLEPVARRTAVCQVADQLRTAVLNMAVGDRLPSEMKLAATFGVSRPVVREALGSLRATGLVASAVGKGWYVASNSIGASLLLGGSYRSDDLNEVRLHLEVPSAGFAALRHKKDDLDFLRRTLQTELMVDNPGSAVRQDGLFHMGVARASGNPLLVGMIEFLRSGLEEQSRALSTVRGRSEMAVAEHWKVLEAISRRDVRAAEEAMRDHLRAVSTAVCALAEPLKPPS